MLGNTTSVNFDDCGKTAGELFLYIRMLIDNKEYEMALATISSHEGDDALCSSLTIDILYSGEMYDELDEKRIYISKDFYETFSNCNEIS